MGFGIYAGHIGYILHMCSVYCIRHFGKLLGAKWIKSKRVLCIVVFILKVNNITLSPWHILINIRLHDSDGVKRSTLYVSRKLQLILVLRLGLIFRVFMYATFSFWPVLLEFLHMYFCWICSIEMEYSWK